jgi:putative ABC transport system permease protein
MLRNYFTIAWRTLWRNRSTTAINLIGLAVSLAVCFLVVLFVHQQWRMDRFHPQADRIHRVETTDGARWTATSPNPLASALRSLAAGVTAATRVGLDRGTFATRGDTSVQLSARYADSSFFDVFSGFRLRSGNRKTALDEPNTAVLTPDFTRRLFGDDADPVGRTFSLRGETTYTVTGVLAPPAGPTHMTGDAFLSYASIADPDPGIGAWTSVFSEPWTYVRLPPGTEPAAVTTVVTDLFRDRVPPSEREEIGFRVQSLFGVQFGGLLMNTASLRTAVPTYFFVFFLALAGVVLLAAGFNYVNLTTAQSLRRAKEIGVRKTAGARRGQLVGQFLGEAVLTSLLAGAGALALLTVLVPLFNDLYIWTLLNIPSLSLDALWSPGLLALLFGITVLFGLAAGSYPAVVLASSEPSAVLGGRSETSSPFGSLSVRTVLIGAQFAFALLLVVAATTLARQSARMAGPSHNLQTERLVSVPLQDVEYDRFREAAARLPDVESVSVLNEHMLGGGSFDTAPLRATQTDASLTTYQYHTDTTFVQAIVPGLEAATEDWTVAYTNGDGALLNETAARTLGFETPTDALGQTIYYGADGDNTAKRPIRVVGVVDNFQFTGTEIYAPAGPTSEDGSIPPLLLRCDATYQDLAVVQSRSGNLAALRDRLESMWDAEIQTIYPFEARFYSDILQERSGPLRSLSSIAWAIALLAVLITVLGLLSIAAHHVQTRTKEIGVRKALGATTRSVVYHLSRDFLRLVGLAALGTLPLAWYLNAQWLRFLPDPVPMGSVALLGAMGGLLLLALLTVGSQTIRAARLDPATTLRDE